MTTDPMAEAIAALTAAARQERTIGAGTPSERTEPVDFAEIACHVLASVAANVGGVETLLAGRPGSWEADLVRQIVTSTVGHDETDLLRWRTEPVKVTVEPADWLAEDMGFDGLLDEEETPLGERVEELEEAINREFLTAAEKAQVAELQRERSVVAVGDVPSESGSERWVTLMKSLSSLYDEARQRAREARHPLYAEMLQIDQRIAAMRSLYDADVTAYAESYRETVRQLLKARGVDHVEFVEVDGSHDQPWQLVVDLVDEVTSEARRTVPLPMTGRPPVNRDDVRAEVLAAGVGYAARLSATGVGRLLGWRRDDEG
ncbi:MAG: hypothetical protein R2722_16325 [Tessaracoccus sp.]